MDNELLTLPCVFIIDDFCPSYAAYINEGLRGLLEEMQVVTTNISVWKVSIIAFGSTADIIIAAEDPRRLDVTKVTTFTGARGNPRFSEALQTAGRLFRRFSGSTAEFRPYVFFFSDGRPDCDEYDGAIQDAYELKTLDIPPGQPIIWSFGYGDGDRPLMEQIASTPKLYKDLGNASNICRFLPSIADITGRLGSENSIYDAIRSW